MTTPNPRPRSSRLSNKGQTMAHRKRETVVDLVETVVGYANGFDRALVSSALSKAELKDLLLDENVEQCPGCRWWVDSSELLNEDDKIDGHCENCRD